MANATPAKGKTDEVKPDSNPTVNKPVKKGPSKTTNGAQRKDN